jgi:hypothetical protein
MPNPINPRFLRIYRVPKPTLEEGEVLYPKPILILKPPLTAPT